MTTEVLVAYGTRYGTTQEVAETVAATLEEQGLEVEVKPARDVRSLDGYGTVVLGTSLYMGALHKDVRALLERHQAALERTPLALFALGPIKAEDGVEGSDKQLDASLAKLPWLSLVATTVFVGAYDPARLGFKDKMIAALPAIPLHGETAHDERDWEAIRAWTTGLPFEAGSPAPAIQRGSRLLLRWPHRTRSPLVRRKESASCILVRWPRHRLPHRRDQVSGQRAAC